MLPVDILRNAAEEGEGDGRLDILVPVDARRHALDDALSDPLVARESSNSLLVLFREAERGEEVFLLVDVVRLEDSREDGKAVLDVERGVEVVAVYARDFLFRE